MRPQPAGSHGASTPPSPAWPIAAPDPVGQLPFAGDLLRLLVAAYEHVLATRSFEHLAVIEFPQLPEVPDYAPPGQSPGRGRGTGDDCQGNCLCLLCSFSSVMCVFEL